MKKYQAAVFGSLLKDIEFFSDEIFIIKNPDDPTRQELLAAEYGAKLPIEKENLHINFGGGAANVCVGLKKLGISAAPIGCVAKDQRGLEIIDYFKKMKIETDLICFDKKEPTGFSFILGSKKNKDHVIFTYKGATMNLKFSKSLLNKIKAEYFYISSMSQQKWANELKKLFHKARQDKTQIIWNPGQRQLSSPKAMLDLLPQTEVLILNKDESIQLVIEFFGKNQKINNVRYLIKKLKNTGPRSVVITEGKKGANVLDKSENFYHLPAYKTKSADTVGAGDAFGSGFLAGWIDKQDAKKALRLGLKNSAAVVSKIGAQNGLLTEKDI